MKRAFTLIELLVVIAIIAILAALLFPVLGRAKQKAWQTIDLNNLKEMGVAMHLVASENDDVMPWPNWLSGDVENGTPREGWLYKIDLTESGPAKFKVQTGLFWPTLQKQEMYFCPSDNTNSPLFQLRGQRISSYVMNGAVCGYSRAQFPPIKLGQLLPQGIVFWECANNTEDDNEILFNDGASRPDENSSARHGKVAIYGAFDGSAGLMSLDMWMDKMDEGTRNELWCYPGDPSGR